MLPALIARTRRKPLAACVAAVFSLSAPAAYATQVVTNCNDSGAGSLRSAVAAAASGELVDATGLNGVCSVISLQTGDIGIGQNSLTIRGPGMDKLTVTGKYGSFPNSHVEPYRIFTHTGTGTLSIQQLSMDWGSLTNASGAALGGCLYSKGIVILSSVQVSVCSANTTSGVAKGGGVYSKQNVVLAGSTVKYNTANAGTSGASFGGGVYSVGNLLAKYSTVSINSASGSSGRVIGLGGGAFAKGQDTYITNSTIDGNTAQLNIGAIAVRNTAGSVTISNSTISGNKAPNGVIGGIYSNTPALYVSNSTIALNTASAAAVVTAGTGIAIYGYGATPVAKFASTIVANNTYGASSLNRDLSAVGVTISGNNNLIRVSGATLPPDTIIGACPLLGPLRDNGGLTRTHALLGHSPAIDTGNNALGSSFDQRGNPFARTSGPPGTMTPVADIGAYEVDRADVIFDNTFEGCP